MVAPITTGDSADKLRHEVDTKLTVKYTLKSSRPVKPRIKVVGMAEKHESGTVLNFLRVQNSSVFREDSASKVLSFEAPRAEKSDSSGSKSASGGRSEVFQSVLELDVNAYQAVVSSG